MIAGKERYELLRASIPETVVLTEKQERYLQWLCRWDDETVEVVAGLIAAGRAAEHDTPQGESAGDSPSYRSALKDAGRGHLLR